jgi:hypothetical protein
LKLQKHTYEVRTFISSMNTPKSTRSDGNQMNYEDIPPDVMAEVK